MIELEPPRGNVDPTDNGANIMTEMEVTYARVELTHDCDSHTLYDKEKVSCRPSRVLPMLTTDITHNWRACNCRCLTSPPILRPRRREGC